MLLTLFHEILLRTNVRKIELEEHEQCEEHERGAGESDAGEQAGGTDASADEAAAADTEVEDAGKNRHGDRRGTGRNEPHELGLQSDVEDIERILKFCNIL